jgi:hypothetical protein
MAALTALHVGLHKTASTSFQVTCANNRQVLKSKGFNYPNLFEDYAGAKTENHSAALYNLFSKRRSSYPLNAGMSQSAINSDFWAYKRKLLSELLKKDNLILSGEDVSVLELEEQEALAIYLSSFSRTLRTFAVIRSPYSLHCSAFAQMIYNGRDLRPARFLSQVEKIKRLSNCFYERGNISKVEFLSFSESLSSPKGPVRLLLEAIGVEKTEDILTTDSNIGRSNEQIRNQMKINSKNPRLIGQSVNPKWYRSPEVAGPKFLLSKQELDLIMPELMAENKWFEDNLGKEFCDTSFPVCD